MSEPIAIQPRLAAAGASSPRNGNRVQLILLHNDPRPAAAAATAYTIPVAVAAPHYHIAGDGTVTQFVADDLAAHHSGESAWQGQPINIDLISIGVALERTPGAPFQAPLLRALHSLVDLLRARHGLAPDGTLMRWDPVEQGREIGPGLLIPVTLPVVPPAAPPGTPVDPGGSGLDDGDTTCSPPPLPPLSGAVLGDETFDLPAPGDLWKFLQQETYRHRGEGFHLDWALHLNASMKRVGTPLAPSTGVTIDGKEYLIQVFSHDVLFNEKPLWNNVQSLNELLGVAIPSGGLARQVLEAGYNLAGNPLKAGWASHQVAVRDRLGPPLGAAYRISVNGEEYSLQVFAGDTLYVKVPNWGQIQRLSQTPPGPLREALWAETYKPGGATYDPDTPFQRIADTTWLGAPLTGPYQAYLNTAVLTVQVFANDTLYSGFDNPPARLSELAPPAGLSTPPPVAVPAANVVVPGGSRDDAVGDGRPIFAMLPVPGQPPISQFYGYTRFAAGGGRQFYTATQSCHSGLDFAVKVGTPLLAIGYGLVVHAGETGPFGAKLPQSIVVRYGSIYALYGHASACRVVKGQFVSPGDEIGQSGSFNGPHLHFELRVVPPRALNNKDPMQNAVNPGRTFNPVDCFSPTLDDYFARMLTRLGNSDGAFCQGSFREQAEIIFGGPLDTRPCQ